MYSCVLYIIHTVVASSWACNCQHVGQAASRPEGVLVGGGYRTLIDHSRELSKLDSPAEICAADTNCFKHIVSKTKKNNFTPTQGINELISLTPRPILKSLRYQTFKTRFNLKISSVVHRGPKQKQNVAEYCLNYTLNRPC